MLEPAIKLDEGRLRELYAQAPKEQDAGKFLTLFQELLLLSAQPKQTQPQTRPGAPAI